MPAIPPNNHLEGLIGSMKQGIYGAYNKGVKYGRYLEQQERLQAKEHQKPLTIDDIKRVLVEVKKICTDSDCSNCPFSSKDTTITGVVMCRLSDDEHEMFTPLCWEVDDWKEDSNG